MLPYTNDGPGANGPTPITRREALRRSAWLLGGAISAPTLAGVLAGCGGDRAEGSQKVLTAGQLALVGAIAEHIIPETDTPGARAAQVDRFIDDMLASYYPEQERALFLAGLDGVDDRARQAHGARFLGCTPEQQRDLLLQLDREAFAPEPRGAAQASAAEQGEESAQESAAESAGPDVRERIEGGASPIPPEAETDTVRWIHGESRSRDSARRPFFRTMKELTVVGYYTSEVGATEELRHEAVPGRHEGCVPFSRIGRTWAV